MQTCLIYARVSSRNQEDGASLDSQVEACRAYAEKQGYTILREVKEVFSGAYLFDRPLLNECREIIREGNCSALIIYDIDRLSRNVPHLGVLLDEAERYNTKLQFVQNDFEKSPEGMLLFSIRGYLAEAERLKIIERTTRGRKSKAKTGTLSFKRKLFGYALDEDGNRQIDENEAASVRRIFAEYLKGDSLRMIAENLNRAGITPPKSATWWASSLYSLLKNPAYCGETVIFRQTKLVKYKQGRRITNTNFTDSETHVTLPEGTTPAIISKEDFERAQQLLSVQKQVKRSLPKREFLLRGLIKCATCGRSMSPQISYKYRAYVCASRQNPTLNCKTKMCAADKAEKLIWDFVVSIIRSEQSVKKWIKELEKNGKGAQGGKIKEIKAAIKKQEKELQTLAGRAATVNDELWELIREQLSGKQKQLGNLKDELARVSAAENQNSLNSQIDKDQISLLLRFVGNYDEMEFSDKADLLKALNISTVWDGEELTVFTEKQQYEYTSDSYGF